MKRYYLECMGIEPWRLQQKSAPVYLSNVVSYRLRGESSYGMLLASVDACNSELTTLTNAIVSALDCTYEERGFAARFNKNLVSHSCRLIILLGQKLAQDWLGQESVCCGLYNDNAGRKIMVSHAPSLLVEAPALKRETWRDLQMVMCDFR